MCSVLGAFRWPHLSSVFHGGVTRQTINLLENGRYNPTLKLCLAICHRLDSSLDQLFWEEQNCQS
nr:helix-turn-helix transcriptional regulator [Corynebacterium simulans]